MHKFLFSLALIASLAGCASLSSTKPMPDATAMAQQAAEQVVYGFEAAFQAAPDIVSALLKNGNITTLDYNSKILPAYNQGLGALNVLIDALRTAEAAKQDPNQVTAYTAALTGFLANKGTLDNLLVAFGTKGVTQ